MNLIVDIGNTRTKYAAFEDGCCVAGGVGVPSAYHFVLERVKEGKHVDVFALDKLSLCEGEKGLPHVYNTDKQHLCIYHRPSEEWNASHKITEIIPWISEWFYYYENWLVTAKWLGGGIHRGKKE